MRYRLILGIALLLAACDQFSKWAVERQIQPFESIRLTSFCNLVNVRNRGAAFGFLNDPSITWQFWLFSGATALAAGVVFFVAKKAGEKERTLFAALGCILGGALGNLVDRIRFRAVFDFLDIHYAGWHWPAFNLADIAICVGAGLAALLLLRTPASENDTGP
jgi:signal peptidase II